MLQHAAIVRTAVALFVLYAQSAIGQVSLGTKTPFLSDVQSKDSFPLVDRHHAAPIVVSRTDYDGVRRAAGDLRDDVHRVTGAKPELTEDSEVRGPAVVLAGTIGKSELIDGLVRTHKIDVSAVTGKWESFSISVVRDPLPGVKQALVIAGSDKRGTIYGIYECSEEAGVSPWYWWADVPAKKHSALYARPGTYVQGPPAVKYRGIFINDEDPALSGWSRAKFGGVNSKMYGHMFELLLRLRANFLWPAMWGKAFNEDDPEDPRLADEYGIVMGTSHHEPLLRAQAEWTHHHQNYGNGQWNYATNAAGLRKFWEEGVVRNRAYENVYTIGMRGDGDKAMPDAGGLEANKKLLETVITDQRAILSRALSTDVTRVPQLWAIYTEVQKYYDAGLKVPDDVTLLFTDDNVGNLRRVPTEAERHRSGGAGIYYHMDMNGGPFSYKWLNSNPLPKIWEQMNLAYRYGADRIWIANVGDLKPLEVPIEFFLRMAWSPNDFGPDQIEPYLVRWAEREFGPAHASEIAAMVAEYAKLNASPKPELVRTDTFSLIEYREAERVYAEWTNLAQRAQALAQQLPQEDRDAYYELVLHPVLACGNAVQLHIVAGRNKLFAEQGRASTNSDANLVSQMFQRDRELTDFYNSTLADGKWNHMMDQVHLGYVNWQSPHQNLMPSTETLTIPREAAFGVAVEGSEQAWPSADTLSLPLFDSLQGTGHYLEVFEKGTEPVQPQVVASAPWIHLRESAAFSSSKEDKRYWVDIDWAALSAGDHEGAVTISGAGAHATVLVRAKKASPEQMAAAMGAFGVLSGPFAFDATHTTTRTQVNGVQWKDLPDYGREDSAVTVFPVTADPIKPGTAAPTLTYDVFLPEAGPIHIDLVTNPTLDIHPDSHLAVAVALDDNPPDTQAVFTDATRQNETFLGKAFGQNDRTNARVMHFEQTVAKPGRHTLHVAMIDPTLVIEKVILHEAPLPPSFFGPPAQQAVHTQK